MHRVRDAFEGADRNHGRTGDPVGGGEPQAPGLGHELVDPKGIDGEPDDATLVVVADDERVVDRAGPQSLDRLDRKTELNGDPDRQRRVTIHRALGHLSRLDELDGGRHNVRASAVRSSSDGPPRTSTRQCWPGPIGWMPVMAPVAKTMPARTD